MAAPTEIKEAVRKLHAVSPEDAATLEAFIDAQEHQLLLYTSEDAFRAFVLAQAQQTGMIQVLLQRIDSSILEPLARAEEAKQQAEMVARQGEAEKALTTRQVLTQPVVLAVVGLASTTLTGLLTLILHLTGVT